MDCESFPGDRWSVALEGSLGVRVAPVPTETREEGWGMSSGQHSDLEEEQVPNLRGVGKGRGAGGVVITGGPGEQ